MLLQHLHFSALWNVVSTPCAPDCANRLLAYDLDNEFWPVIWAGWNILDLPQCKHSIDHFTENYVFPVQEIAFCRGDEELKGRCCEPLGIRAAPQIYLGSIGVWAGIRLYDAEKGRIGRSINPYH